MAIAQAFAGGTARAAGPGSSSRLSTTRRSEIGDQLEDLGGGVAERSPEAGEPGADPARGTRRAARRRLAFIVVSNWLRGPRAPSSLRARYSPSHRRRPRRGRVVGLPQQQRRGRCVGKPCSGKKCGSRAATMPSHDEQPGVAVVGVQPVALPRVVAEHDVGLQLADHRGDLADGSLEVAVELAVDAARGTTTSPRVRPRNRRAASRCSSWRCATSAAVSASGSHVPFEPSVQTRWWTTQPAAAHLASVAPQPNSTSSGCAPIAERARRRRQVARERVSEPAPASAPAGRARWQPWRAALPARADGRGRRACRCRAPSSGSRRTSTDRAARRSPRRGGGGTSPGRRRTGTPHGGRDADDVGAVAVAVGHERDGAGPATAARPSRARGRSPWATITSVTPASRERGHAVVDRAVEADARMPQHRRAVRASPTRRRRRRRTRRTTGSSPAAASTRSGCPPGQRSRSPSSSTAARRALASGTP